MIDDAIATLIGTHASGARVYPSTALIDANTLPRVMYTAINAPRDYTDSGVAGIVPGVYQLDAVAKTATQARAILKSIADGLDGYSGTSHSTTIVRIYFPDEPRFGPVAPANEGANQSTPRLIREMRINYRP